MQIAGMSLDFHLSYKVALCSQQKTEPSGTWTSGRILVFFLHPGWDFLDFCTWKFSTSD